MKPGLRKVAALILATATLFGSGASAVSAAYADDTTMGTSTRIQTEPDVKTTTGGDEAATKPDTGSGDEAGTGADEQSGTGAPAQSAPQADAGQAAPDVTIHDMLDTDSAAVSRLGLTDRITGTAPFDKDNERGDDKDETNDIVRSYDTVTYDYEYTLTPDSTMDYYRRTRVGFRFELPYPQDRVTFDAEKMGWVDHTPGYEPKLTTETIDGTVTQVYTCYRLLEPTSQSPTVNPGTGSIGLSVAVKGAPHGYRFHPTVKAWTAWDASNPTNTGTHKRAVDTPKDVTVSAKLSLNVRMVDYGNVDRGVFDFSSGAANAPNRTEGKVTGLGLGVALVTEMRWPDRTKGLKGLEAPSGRITYRLRLSNQYSDDTKTGTKHPMERRWQPLLYDYGHIDNMDSKYGRTFAWMGDLWYRAPGVADRADGYDSVARGDTTVTTTTGGQGTDVTVSFDGYDTSVLPIHNKFNGTQNKCSTDYMTSDCSTMQVGAIHTDVLQFITPTSRDGKLTVANKGTGFTFGRMTYTKPGAYTYHVKELAGTDKTIGYSTQEYDVTVTVTDQGGMLSASADRQATDVRFDNTYTPTPVDVTVKADKRLTGRDLNDGEFAAELKDSDGNLLQTKRFARVPRDAQSDKATDVREGEGTLEFDKLTFDRAGVYTYTVTEQDGDLGGVTYDRTVHTVTVTVTEDADSHTLTAKTEYSTENGSEDGIRFTNTYQPQNVLVELTARKRLTGRGLKVHEFEFELVDRDGKVIDTERNDKDGDIRFKPLTYGRDNNGIDDCGEHRYVIRERNTGEKNVTYDRTEHHVTVTVGDDLQGNLTAKVEYDPTDGKTKDSSATPTDKADRIKGDAVGDKPSTTPGMVTVTGTRPEFTNSYIPPATPAIVKTIRQLAKTGVSAPTVALAAFTLLGVGLMLFRRRGNQTETARHRK